MALERLLRVSSGCLSKVNVNDKRQKRNVKDKLLPDGTHFREMFDVSFNYSTGRFSCGASRILLLRSFLDFSLVLEGR